MALSGLALAGGSTTLDAWSRGSIPAPSNDGILSAEEFSHIELPNTDLVVLSACETALGKTETGEGVVGLRKALQLTGARHVIMTLWEVDDKATSEFMAAFYKRYLQNKDVMTSLQSTKNELYQTWKNEHGEYLATFFVAPFISIGQ